MVGGRDQLREELWIGPRRGTKRRVHGLDYRQKRGAGRFVEIDKLAVENFV